MRQIKLENPGNIKETWSKLIAYSKNYIPYVILALIGSSLSSILIILGPNKLSAMTDAISQGLSGEMDWSTITSSAWSLVLYYGISALLLLFVSYTMGTITARLAYRMRSDISVKINQLPLSYFDNTSYGDVLSRITNDVDSIGQALNQSIANIVRSIFMVLGSLVMMFITNWQLALIAVISSLSGFAVMGYIMSRSQQYFTRQQMSLGAVNGHIEEIFTNHNIVKTYNGQKDERNKFEILNEELYENGWLAQFMSSLMQPIITFIGNFAYVAVVVIGAILAKQGTITFGVIIAFMIYVRQFTQPLNQMAQAGQNIQMASAAGERVFDFLEEEELADESHKTYRLENVKGDVQFEQVVFSYDGNTPVINDFSLQVNATQQIAIVGPTGAGKTTLINLLMRFYEINSGHIYIDGVDINDITRSNLRDQFGMVLQDTWLYEGTIRDNIVYNQQGITDEQVEAVIKTVGLDHYINTLPDGIDTIVDERASLSEGQQQLITIARAMIKNAPLLILDEATSSVDTRTELLVQEAMAKLTEGRTSFIIAHRLSTIKDADHIIVMNHGDIVEQGKHEDLLEKGGFYADLYNSQFEG